MVKTRIFLMAAALAVGVVSTANASTIVVRSDTTWLATNFDPAPGWNLNPFFNTAGWTNAVSHCDDAFYGECIWYDGQFTSTAQSWMRRTFTVTGPITAAELVGGIDDDGDVYLNGNLVYSDHNGFAQAYGPIDVAPYLVQGLNLIAVSASDNIPVWGQNHGFTATIRVETPTAVPEPGSLVLFATGLVAVGVLRRRCA